MRASWFLTICASVMIATAPGCSGGRGAERPELSNRWLTRSLEHQRLGEFADAQDAMKRALTASDESDTELRIAAAKLALGRLEFAPAIEHLQGIEGSEAHALRGRAYWYNGDLDRAADELEALLANPEIVDDWAKAVAKLCRSGAGRQPFTTTGSIVAAIDMPRVHPVVPYGVVPVEIDGESHLALVATGVGELSIDKSARAEPSWVSLRFGGRFEVRDVPALPQDFSTISKQLGAPIRALIGIHLLRRLNATIDFRGHQFVVRSFSPPTPPNAAQLGAFYIRGGGLMLASQLGTTDPTRTSLLVDSALAFPLALTDRGLTRAGLTEAALKPIAEDTSGKMKEATVPVVRLAGVEIGKVPAVVGAGTADVERSLHAEIDGLLGAGMFAQFRATFADGGRTVFMEDATAFVGEPAPVTAAPQAGTP